MVVMRPNMTIARSIAPSLLDIGAEPPANKTRNVSPDPGMQTALPMTSISHLDELNGEQRRAAEHGIGPKGVIAGPILVIAGAGSGKTKTIAHRVAHLIEQGTDPRRVLLLTFSRRAAAETARRVERIAARIAGMSAAVITDVLAWSGTFHAVGVRFLREYAEEIGLDPNFTIHDREDSADLMNMARHDLGRFAWIVDPEDNRVELWEPKRAPRRGPLSTRRACNDRGRAGADYEPVAIILDRVAMRRRSPSAGSTRSSSSPAGAGAALPGPARGRTPARRGRRPADRRLAPCLRLRVAPDLSLPDRGRIFDTAHYAFEQYQGLARPDSGRAALVRFWRAHGLTRSPVPLTGAAQCRPAARSVRRTRAGGRGQSSREAPALWPCRPGPLARAHRAAAPADTRSPACPAAPDRAGAGTAARATAAVRALEPAPARVVRLHRARPLARRYGPGDPSSRRNLDGGAAPGAVAVSAVCSLEPGAAPEAVTTLARGGGTG